MDNNAENPRAVVGGNMAPFPDVVREADETLIPYLIAENAAVTDRVKELIDGFKRLPEEIKTAEDAGNYTQFIAMATACIKEAEAKRVDITAPPLKAQRDIMGFYTAEVFTKIGAPTADKGGSFGGAKGIATQRLTLWDREQRRLDELRRQEAERIAREEAAKAERARQEAERLAREAAAAEQRRLAEEKRKADEAAAAAAKAIRDEQDLDKAIALEAQAKIDAEARQKAAAEAQARADAEAKATAARAEQARLDAEKAAAAAQAKADTHSVGAYGAKSTLRDNWKFRITNFDELDLNQVKSLFKMDEIERAYNAAAKNIKNTRKLAGGEMYNDDKSTVRG